MVYGYSQGAGDNLLFTIWLHFQSFLFSSLSWQPSLWFLFPTMDHFQLGKWLGGATYCSILITPLSVLLQKEALFTCQGMKGNAEAHYVKSHQIALLNAINKTPTTSAEICAGLQIASLDFSPSSLSQQCWIDIKPTTHILSPSPLWDCCKGSQQKLELFPF